MSYRIREIKIGELKDFIDSKEFEELPYYPISKIRALSHINNPRAEQSDVALFLSYDNEKFVGYLGGMPELMFSKGKNIKVFWLSCMWILPDYRRKGVALELMNYAYEAYNQKTLITNYIPQSKAVFDKTGCYELLTELKGIRGFVRFDLATILQRKYKAARRISWFLKGVDAFINIFFEAGYNLTYKRLKTECTYTGVDSIDENLGVFIQSKSNTSPFKRGANEFDWIIKYPWVVNGGIPETERKKYFFSHQASDFKQWYIKVEKENKIVGFLVITMLNGELKTPYLYYEESYSEDITTFISQLIIGSGINTFVCHDQNIVKHIQKRKIFLYKKESTKGFLISKKLRQELAEDSPIIFEGDGDSAFT